jgi:hypothetical protein
MFGARGRRRAQSFSNRRRERVGARENPPPPTARGANHLPVIRRFLIDSGRRHPCARPVMQNYFCTARARVARRLGHAARRKQQVCGSDDATIMRAPHVEKILISSNVFKSRIVRSHFSAR